MRTCSKKEEREREDGKTVSRSQRRLRQRTQETEKEYLQGIIQRIISTKGHDFTIVKVTEYLTRCLEKRPVPDLFGLCEMSEIQT